MTSQKKQILSYLRKGYKLTPIEALNLFGCFRLGARIYELKKDGYNILSEMISVNGKRFSKYKLNTKK